MVIQVDPFLHLVEDRKLQAVKTGPAHPTNVYGSKEDDNLALNSLSEIEITEEQTREFFASEIVKSLDKLSDVSFNTNFLSFLDCLLIMKRRKIIFFYNTANEY